MSSLVLDRVAVDVQEYLAVAVAAVLREVRERLLDVVTAALQQHAAVVEAVIAAAGGVVAEPFEQLLAEVVPVLVAAVGEEDLHGPTPSSVCRNRSTSRVA